MLLASRLATVARDAQALTIGHLVATATFADRNNVIGVGLAGAAAHMAALSAPPSVSNQYSLPPLPVCLVAIPTGCRVGPAALVSLGA